MTASELMKAMAAAGAPFEAILIAVEALDAKDAEIAARDAERAEKRAKDAERKRVRRASTDIPRTVHETVQPDPSLSLPPNENNSNPPTHTHPDMTTRAREADPFPKPDWCENQVWKDLKANRKAKRLPCTPTAHAKLLRDINRLADDEWPPGRLIEAIVARGWAAAYDPRPDRNETSDRSKTVQPGNGHSPDRRSTLARAIDEGIDWLGGAQAQVS